MATLDEADWAAFVEVLRERGIVRDDLPPCPFCGLHHAWGGTHPFCDLAGMFRVWRRTRHAK